VLAGTKTTNCQFCSRRFGLDRLRQWYSTDLLDEAVEAVGRLNSERMGREKDFDRVMDEVEDEAKKRPDEDSFETPHQYVAFLMRNVSGERKRMEAAARHLTEVLGEFGQEDMVECLLEANVDTERVDEYIEVMARANLLLYKGNGKYEYIE